MCTCSWVPYCHGRPLPYHNRRCYVSTGLKRHRTSISIFVTKYTINYSPFCRLVAEKMPCGGIRGLKQEDICFTNNWTLVMLTTTRWQLDSTELYRRPMASKDCRLGKCQNKCWVIPSFGLLLRFQSNGLLAHWVYNFIYLSVCPYVCLPHKGPP